MVNSVFLFFSFLPLRHPPAFFCLGEGGLHSFNIELHKTRLEKVAADLFSVVHCRKNETPTTNNYMF